MEQSLNDKRFLQEQQQILNHIHIIFQLIQENYEREIEEKITGDERFRSVILTVFEKWLNLYEAPLTERLTKGQIVNEKGLKDITYMAFFLREELYYEYPGNLLHRMDILRRSLEKWVVIRTEEGEEK